MVMVTMVVVVAIVGVVAVLVVVAVGQNSGPLTLATRRQLVQALTIPKTESPEAIVCAW